MKTPTEIMHPVKEKIMELEGEKAQAYWERNQFVIFLSKLYPSHFCYHPVEDLSWEKDWRTIVCIHSPIGQMTWHIHNSEVYSFTHLGGSAQPNHWDGHTTEEKYKRLLELGDWMRKPEYFKPEEEKKILYNMQGGKCNYPDCTVTNIDELTKDHKMPKSVARILGWTEAQIESINNKQLMCRPHHEIKDAKNPEHREKMMQKHNVEK